ncbi:MAG: hypothetical protein ACHQFW_00260, partial [Chitinophagales bacterium]
NSCYYDGNNILGGDYSLGYILGDEGSGSYFGKRLLRDYFYSLLPEDLHNKFAKQYAISRTELIERIYKQDFPNEYLASYLPFFKENASHPYCSYFINFGFEEFIRIYIYRFPNFKVVDIWFVGSVAFHFQEQLLKACKETDIHVAGIIQSPISQLANYHYIRK